MMKNLPRLLRLPGILEEKAGQLDRNPSLTKIQRMLLPYLQDPTRLCQGNGLVNHERL